MTEALFAHIDTWVFDLDNTLYPPEVRLFDQIEIRMTDYVMRSLNVGRQEADQIRSEYWAKFGTTLAGLMDIHDVDPTPYLTEVHDIDFSVLPYEPKLGETISELQGRKIIYTNGTADYAAQVAEARGILGAFDAIYGVENANFRPKPERQAFDAIVELDGFDPQRAAMFEDDVRNLSAPKSMGMTTVLVAPQHDPKHFVDIHTDDLHGFLVELPGSAKDVL